MFSHLPVISAPRSNCYILSTRGEDKRRGLEQLEHVERIEHIKITFYKAMNSEDFLNEILAPVNEFSGYRCRSYGLLLRSSKHGRRTHSSDKEPLFNEFRAADIFGAWLKTTPEFDVKATIANPPTKKWCVLSFCPDASATWAQNRFDYKSLPAQIAMFNAMEGLNEACERIAGLSLPAKPSPIIDPDVPKVPDVPEQIKQPYRRITQAKRERQSAQEPLKRYGRERTARSVRRTVAIHMVLFREYVAGLDRWAMDKDDW